MDAASILTSGAILGSVGLAFGALIAVANRRLRVWEDPRIEGTTELLPGTNCGACGSPGCRGFAERLVAGEVQPSGCTQVDEEQVEAVASYLGVDAGEAVKRVARLLCAGGSDVSVRHGAYTGEKTCVAAAAAAGGGKACSWGCLGLADCAIACDYGAIVMNEQDLPVVIPDKCTACNDCVVACPKDLFEIMPVTEKLIVQCKSLMEGDAAVDTCEVACTGCGKCAMDSPTGVIDIKDGLAIVNYELNDEASEEATKRCPTGAIQWIEWAQFESTKSIQEKATH
jgi:Na+-translocating ferredoxin:NAD+ oxidoreductase RNF subunit RnfB